MRLPFCRNHQFCGREDFIEAIRSAFEESTLSRVTEAQPMIRKVVILYGLGGIGKSSIALEYSFRHSGSYTGVFWVDASSEASLFRSACGLAEQLIGHYASEGMSFGEIASLLRLDGLLGWDGRIVAGEAEERKITRAIKEWLMEEGNERWLLIFDNYDGIEVVNIYDLLPSSDTGHVIITSQRSDLHALGRTLEID
jgi:hypothetical protein